MQAIFDSVLIAPPYVCLALAYGLVYGMLGIMDLSIPARYTAAAYAGWVASHWLLWYPALDPLVLLGSLFGAVVMCVFCWKLVKPLGTTSPMATLVGSLGLSYVVQAFFQLVFGAAPRVFTKYPAESGWEMLSVTATPLQWIGVCYAVTATVAVVMLTRSHRWGHRLQAVASNASLASATLGISVNRVTWSVMLVASVIVAPAGVIYAIGHGVSPTTGVDIGLVAFVAAIIAGRNRPVTSALVAFLLVLIRGVAIRFSIWEILGFLLAATATWYLLSQFRTSRLAASVAALAAGCFGYQGILIFEQRLSPTMATTIIPAAFQDVVTYSVILVIVLLRPAGLLLNRTGRAV
jgi:branched-chain amino acid transport system permease protein